MSSFQPFRDSTKHLGDGARLRDTLHEEGYLFLRRLVDPQQIATVKQDIMRILREHHIIEDDGADDPMWSGGPHPTEGEYMAFYDKIARMDSFVQLAESPEIVALMEGIFDGPVQVWTQRLIRVMYPDPDAPAPIGLGAHQDGNFRFGYQSQSFNACWMPLMEINQELGGLAVSPGSHIRGELDHGGGSVASSAKGVKEKKVFGLDAESRSWVTSDFEPGDAVIFTSLTVHRGILNRSDRIRLSCDFRYQRVDDSASWLAHTLGPDIRRVAQQIDELLSSRAFFVTTRASEETIADVRLQMLEEKSTSLKRAQEIAKELAG
ncbi:MAG: phytanoyl-CoA dioxygenase family protein [Caldilineaceae bacterium]|nr:phytanoyl-CoA dioxygenase family protein [Caldilineaceae bacterium]MCY4116969.1 phytanoyl-CoA dioxygenase family protein [Caldilineaceae bacterium]MDE0070988.1 phytanoyl-CoA dioxygenase family protein [Caldilineaceae bacterium]MDE0183175.1 phytanoyl-CoA dioxygenase family protein [Caldilineaceae bacterium]MDE0430140.1 phytanoyl-CoA dioxygenase family protein [Caldilineaceae bacterium]